MDKVYHKVRYSFSRVFLVVLSLIALQQAVVAKTGGNVLDQQGVQTGIWSTGDEAMIPETSGNIFGLANMAGSFSFLPLQASSADPAATSLTVEKQSLLQTLTVVSLVLVAIILLLIFISVNLSNLIRVREGKEPMTFASIMATTWERLLNPYINSLAMLGGTIVLLFIVVPIARGVGHHEGYTPDQPIKFSHKIHAGDWQIDCQYCHIGASRGKYATIPSTNICMNCHTAIREGKRWKTAEIDKIVASWTKKNPIEWTRIHNLPDLAYFNHQQHVVMGKVACQTCHGPVQEIDYPMYQFNRLSMGWCVNCHRQTQVDADYYKMLGIESEDPKNDPLVVSDIGGLDCVRCHY